MRSLRKPGRADQAFPITLSRMTATGIRNVRTGRGEPLRLEARQQEERQNLWRYVILLMIVALVAESLIAARTA